MGLQDRTEATKDRRILISFIILAILFTCAINIFLSITDKGKKEEISYNTFLEMLKEKAVGSVEIYEDRLVVTQKEEEHPVEPTFHKKKFVTGNVQDPMLFERLDAAGVLYQRPIEDKNPVIDFIATWVLPAVLLYVIFSMFLSSVMKKMGDTSTLTFGKNTAKIYAEKETGVTFLDVAGQEEAKESLSEIVDFLNRPERYKKIGARLPKGALLMGPPGTGKTLLAKAVAGEARAPFFSISGSEFVEMFVGVGASRVRDLFRQAMENAPCIIFIDEIDAIGKSRESQSAGSEEREQTLNQLLSEMDGFDASKGVVILGATNRPEVLDKALLRPGRFDRRVIVDKPDVKGREAILRVHSKTVRMDKSVDFRRLAQATSGCVGADLANIMNEGALRAVRMGRALATQEDFMESIEVIVAGKEKKDRILTENEKKIVAYHEVGHALAAVLLKGGQPVHKITIVPRTMGALGYTIEMPEKDRYLLSKEELFDRVITYLAGRAAEEVIFQVETTGAKNDIEKATALARSMATRYGMTKRFDMVSLEWEESAYLDGEARMNCSEKTAAAIDDEVLNIIRECHSRALLLLEENRGLLCKIAEYLLERETISGQEFMALFTEKQRQDKERLI